MHLFITYSFLCPTWLTFPVNCVYWELIATSADIWQVLYTWKLKEKESDKDIVNNMREPPYTCTLYKCRGKFSCSIFRGSLWCSIPIVWLLIDVQAHNCRYNVKVIHITTRFKMLHNEGFIREWKLLAPLLMTSTKIVKVESLPAGFIFLCTVIYEALKF